MLFFFLQVILQITLAFCFFHYLKRRRDYSILFGVAFLLGCALFGFAVHIWSNGYSYNLQLDKKKLEALLIDLETAQQFEEWFCPDERIASPSSDEQLYMTKTISFEEPNGYIRIKLVFFRDRQAAINEYDHSLIVESKYRNRRNYTIKMAEADIEYCCTRTSRELSRDSFGAIFLFWLLPYNSYNSNAKVRYENIIFDFVEYSTQRKSRIAEVIDQLLLDYEQYMENMN